MLGRFQLRSGELRYRYAVVLAEGLWRQANPEFGRHLLSQVRRDRSHLLQAQLHWPKGCRQLKNFLINFLLSALCNYKDVLLGRVDKRDSQDVLNVIQAGICDGDQLGTRPDV